MPDEELTTEQTTEQATPAEAEKKQPYILIDEGIVRHFNEDGDVIAVVPSDSVAEEYFNRSRPFLGALEASMRWMSPSHGGFLHERPPRMLRIYIDDKLYYLPVPWTVLATLVNTITGKVERSQIFFAQSQISYGEQELFYPEIPVTRNKYGLTVYHKEYIDLSSEDSDLSAILNSSNIVRDGDRAHHIYRDNFADDIIESFTDEGDFNYARYLEELGELSLKDALYVHRKHATTVGQLIEDMNKDDKEINKHFYEQKDSFNYLADIISMISEKQLEWYDEMEMDEPDPEYDPEHYDQEEPF